MLPKFLLPSYKQYKADSHAVATWLASTAIQCGYPKSLQGRQAPSGAPRPKGKARKAARDGAGPSAEPSEDVRTYAINVKDFVPLAQWIVKATAKVPAAFTMALDRAITVRKRHQRWWQSQPASGGTAADSGGHRFFILVLEKVRQVLEPLLRPENGGSQMQPSEAVGRETTKVDNIALIPNLFENLELEEPSEAFLAAEPVKKGSNTPKETFAKYKVDLANDEEELSLALSCLMSDYAELRAYLQGVWNSYKQGTIDLVAASLTTNTAVDLARGIHEDFVESFPNAADFAVHISYLYVTISRIRGIDPTAKLRPDDDMNFALYDEAEAIFMPTFMFLDNFKKLISPGSIPTYKPGYYGYYDASQDRSKMSAREKWLEDKIVLLESFPEFCVQHSEAWTVCIEDEMIRGMRDILKSPQKPTPMWLVFASQVFLDINHILRDTVDRAFNELVRAGEQLKDSAKKTLQFQEVDRIPTWPKSNDKVLEHLEEVIYWISADKINISGYPPNFLMKRHPVHCGLSLYLIRVISHRIGIDFSNAWGGILYSAHLYNAVLQEGFVATTWPDMDLVMTMHGKENMFVGDHPRTLGDYYKRFLLAMGFSATAFGQRTSRTTLHSSQKGARRFSKLAPVAHMFGERYAGAGTRTVMSPADLVVILTEHERIQARKRTAPPKTGPGGSSGAHTAMRPVELLSMLLEVLQQEVVAFAFDHLQFHLTCWELLRAVRARVDGKLQEYYTANYIDQEHQLPFMVGYIFLTGTAGDKATDGMFPKRKLEGTSKILMDAGEAMEQFLHDGRRDVQRRQMEETLGITIATPISSDLVGARDRGDVELHSVSDILNRE